MTQTGTGALDRALALLAAVAADDGATPLGAIATSRGVPAPTAYRIASALVRHGLLVRLGGGRYAAGVVRAAERHAIAARAARPVLTRLAHATGRTAHLGAFDGEMVTYLVREGGAAFTREGEQLEAYCSAVGKMLLASRPEAERERYLAVGGFVPLTARTIVDPGALRDHLATVAATGFATDDEEVADDLFCLAVMADVPAGLAVSLAGTVPAPEARSALLAALRAAAADIGARLGARPRPVRQM